MPYCSYCLSEAVMPRSGYCLSCGQVNTNQEDDSLKINGLLANQGANNGQNKDLMDSLDVLDGRLDNMLNIDLNLDIDSDDDNRRIAVRYVRSDISVTISTPSGLFTKSGKVSVGLIDISSKGLLVDSYDKLPLGKEVGIELTFTDKRQFLIKGMVVYKMDTVQYGIKFDGLNDALGDYLLQSADDIVFKLSNQ